MYKFPLELFTTPGLPKSVSRLVPETGRFSEAKCNVLHVGLTSFEQSMINTSVEAIPEEKDLGVTIDWDMNFHMYVSKTANKASRMLGLEQHSPTSMTLLRLLTTMVRPHLEYGNVS